ncbi:MAG: C-GCAxxG-C-C family (seleno)protein [Clostridiaceae bacterium]|nr:C-GCAxxG-C-C family (seleno)protein [Clostridiaceae bacterium]
MLRERAVAYYLDHDYNCAESILLAANDEYALGLSPDAFHLLSPFGGGCGCGRICGALAGGLAVIGSLAVRERAHATKDFGRLCEAYVQSFESALGSDLCAVLKPRYVAPPRRCAATVEQAADILDAFLREKNLL